MNLRVSLKREFQSLIDSKVKIKNRIEEPEFGQ